MIFKWQIDIWYEKYERTEKMFERSEIDAATTASEYN